MEGSVNLGPQASRVMPRKLSPETALFLRAFDDVSSMPKYANRWLCDALWFDAVTRHFQRVLDIGLDRVKLVKVINGSYKSHFHHFGEAARIYHVQFKMSCPKGGIRRNVNFYYSNPSMTILHVPREATGAAFVLNNPQYLPKAMENRKKRNEKTARLYADLNRSSKRAKTQQKRTGRCKV